MLHRARTILFVLVLLSLFSSLSTGASVATAQQTGTSTVYVPMAFNSPATKVTGSLQATLDEARPGDTITLGAATYTGSVTVRRAGTASAPITLKGEGVGKSIIRGTLRIEGDAAFWRIQDLDVNAEGTSDAVRIEAPAGQISLQRVHLYGGKGYGVRIGNNVSGVTIEGSEINDFDAGSSDAHGIGIMTASNITIRGCNIHHNSGDAIQSNTPDYPGYGRFASNILIENNQLHENRENALDIKSTRGLIMRNNRAWGFRAVDSSDGMAIQVQYDARDISITGNEIWDAVEGIEVTRGKKNGTAYPAAPQNITIAGNLFRDIVADEAGDSANGSGIVVRTSTNVKVYNNTVLRAANAGVYLSYSSEEDKPAGVDIRNNVLDGRSSDIELAAKPQEFAGLVVDFNHYVNSSVDGGTLVEWLTKGFERNATTGNPLLNTEQLPLPGSPLLDSGVNVGLPFSGARPDRGWSEFASN